MPTYGRYLAASFRDLSERRAKASFLGNRGEYFALAPVSRVHGGPNLDDRCASAGSGTAVSR